jgi:hypothetical protein
MSDVLGGVFFMPVEERSSYGIEFHVMWNFEIYESLLFFLNNYVNLILSQMDSLGIIILKLGTKKNNNNNKKK